MKKLLVLASALILSLGLSAQELGNFVGIRNAVARQCGGYVGFTT